jgi:hypothetical protein
MAIYIANKRPNVDWVLDACNLRAYRKSQEGGDNQWVNQHPWGRKRMLFIRSLPNKRLEEWVGFDPVGE